MKNILLTTLLLLIAGLQTAIAQKVTLYMAGNQTFEYDIAQLDSIVFSEAQPIQEEEIIVTVDANGNADGGHLFTRIDIETFLIDGIIYKYENGSLTVIGYDQVFFSGTAKIISKLIYNGRTMNVVGIGEKAFFECTNLTSITIPKSVTSIEGSAFYGCSKLTSVNIQSDAIVSASRSYDTSMKYIFGEQVTKYVIGDAVTCIGESAFYGCNSLTSVTIGNGVTSIGDYAFYYCSGLTSITIPNSVTKISSRAFYGCGSLTSIIIPENVTSIGSYVFSSCGSLTSIQVEEGNTTYDSRNNCNAIIETATNTLISGCQTTIMPESVTSIGSGAFSACTSLTTITIGSGVTSIGERAFSGCKSLTSITIGNSVTSIDDYAFGLCSSLTDVYCYAENVPSTTYLVFDYSPIESATLRVPAGSVDAYKRTYPWSLFKSIVAIE